MYVIGFYPLQSKVMTSTAPNENVKDNIKEQISCKLVSEIIRERIQANGARFHANDNISDFIQPGELETLEREVATRVRDLLKTLKTTTITKTFALENNCD